VTKHRDYAKNVRMNRRHREALGLLPPKGDWCGCCGRPCGAGDIWCRDCKTHVTGAGAPWDQTWSATHPGQECPFVEVS